MPVGGKALAKPLLSSLGKGWARSSKPKRNTGFKSWGTVSMFTGSSKPWLGKASLDCKAGEAKHLLSLLVAY